MSGIIPSPVGGLTCLLGSSHIPVTGVLSPLLSGEAGLSEPACQPAQSRGLPIPSVDLLFSWPATRSRIHRTLNPRHQVITVCPVPIEALVMQQ